MNVDANKPATTVTIPVAKYQKLLEEHFEQSMAIQELNATLKAEYDFAEKKIEENKALGFELSRMIEFINSENLTEKYKEFCNDKEETEAKEVGENDGEV